MNDPRAATSIPADHGPAVRAAPVRSGPRPVTGGRAPRAEEAAFGRSPGARPNARRTRAVLLMADAVALSVAAVVGAATATRTSAASTSSYVLLALLSLASFSLYRLRVNLSALDDAPRLATALILPLAAVAPLTDAGRSVGLQTLAGIPAVVLARSLAYAVIRRRRRAGPRERTLVAGTGQVGIDLAAVVGAHPEYGLELVGFAGEPAPNLPGPVLADVENLDEAVRRHEISRVLVAFGPTREAELVGVLRAAARRDVEVHIVPRFFDIGVAPRGVDVDDLWGIPVYRMRQAARRAAAWRFKRALDLAVASVLLLACAPVMAVAAVLVKIGSPGPVLFRQRRIGEDGEEFEVLKFRTLPADHRPGAVWNAWDTEQLTPVGRWLRRLSIDELPQLWNVLRGDMSLVGPRPELRHFVEQFTESVYGYGDRHRLPAGLTGWAQVHGLRGATSLRERARFDNQYIEQWSLWRDVTILIRTLSAFVSGPHPGVPAEAGEGAHREIPRVEPGRGATPVSGAAPVTAPRADIAESLTSPDPA